MISFDTDIYQGITLHTQNLPSCSHTFAEKIDDILAFACHTSKRIIWISLSISQSHLIPVLTERQFIFHSCSHDSITLVFKMSPEIYVPFSPTHTIGLGGVVLRKQQQEILIIKERLNDWIKLPGGHMELDETIEQGVMRETYEETGVQTSFNSIIAVASKYPYQLGKSNIYLACHLTAIQEEINVQDTEEIEYAQWITLEHFFQNEAVSRFAKDIVRGVLTHKGLSYVKLTQNTLPHEKRELFTL